MVIGIYPEDIVRKNILVMCSGADKLGDYRGSSAENRYNESIF